MLTRRGFLQRTSAAGVMAAVPWAASWASQGSASDRGPSTSHKRGVVQTVLGPVDASKLGFTLPHEHICASSAGFWRAWPEYFGGRQNFIAQAVDKLKLAKAAGIDTIVDVTTFDAGRDPRLLEEISRKSGMQIVVCTGHWLDPSLSMRSLSLDELTAFFTREIEQGIEDTGIRPGVIKVATDQEGMTPFLEKTVRAAARTSKATGVPVTTHTHAPGRTGEQQAAIFEAEGVNPATVCLGHSDDTDDMAYLIGLAKRGYMIGMDHLSWGVLGRGRSWQQRADSIKQLVDAGHADKLFLSNDWMLGMSTYPAALLRSMEKGNPDGMLFTNRKVIPYLKHIGVSDETIRIVTVDNPRRFFGGLT